MQQGKKFKTGIKFLGLAMLALALFACGRGKYSNDELLKQDGVAPPPPMSIVPERPLSGAPVTVTIAAPGSTSVSLLTVEGTGAGGLAPASGASPLVVSGSAGSNGYCHLTAQAVYPDASIQNLEGFFEVQATSPSLPPIKVSGAVFETRAFPASSGGAGAPLITGIDGSPTFINGSSAPYTIAYSGPNTITSILVQIPGYSGYFRVPVYVSGATLSFTLNFDSDFFAAPSGSVPERSNLVRQAASGLLVIKIALEDDLSFISNIFDFNLTGQEVGYGDVKVSISWNTATDVDLHVTEPGGEEIYYGNRTSATSGQLDLDSNAGCSIDGVNKENIYWPAGASPQGDYTVSVQMYADCEVGGAGGTITISYCGEDSPISEGFSLGSTGSSQSWTFISQCAYKVSGTMKYEDFPVTNTGLGASAMVPVRQAKVQIVRAKDDKVLAEGSTDEAGKYDIDFKNDGEKGYYVQLLASQDSDTLKQEVRDLAGNLYAFRTETEIDESLEPIKKDVDLSIAKVKSAGALNIFDVGVACSSYARLYGGKAPPELTFHWTAGEKPEGDDASFYRSSTKKIYVLGDPSDSDEYDDVILGHEYGHFVMDQYGKDNSPGGHHSSNTQSVPTLAWSEGWATFFACAANSRSSYADTNAAGMGVFYSIETLPDTKPLGNKDGKLEGNLSEAVAAAVLMDLFDATNETNDTISSKSTAIWAVLTGYLGATGANFKDRGAAGRDLVDFLDGWFCTGYGEKGDTDTEGVRGIVKTLHQLSYDFKELDSCK